MVLPYLLRLLCLCCASFFMIHLAMAVAARLSAGTAVRVAQRMKPDLAGRLLFLLRIVPMSLALFALFAFCIPSYLWLEPEAAGEKVGALFIVTAFLGALSWALSVARVVRAVNGTARYLQHCEQHGRSIEVPGEASPALLMADRAPVLAIAGVVNPRLVISQPVMDSLSSDQIDAALRHERAHRTSRDNLKRFLLLLAPDVLPFVRGFAEVERHWAKFAEWAADDRATAGDPGRALSLASALVRVAKLGARPQLSYLSSSLAHGDQDLQERVDRLLSPQPDPGQPAKLMIPLVSCATALIAASTAVVVLWPGTLSAVHEVLEQLVR